MEELLEILSILTEKQRRTLLSKCSTKMLCEIADVYDKRNYLTEDEDSLKRVGIGAAVGAGIGALGSLGVWGVKRLKLRKKWKECENLPHGQISACKEVVEQEIRNLRKKALAYGAAATAAGAGVGTGVGVGVNRQIDKKNLQKQTMERELQQDRKKTNEAIHSDQLQLARETALRMQLILKKINEIILDIETAYTEGAGVPKGFAKPNFCRKFKGFEVELMTYMHTYSIQHDTLVKHAGGYERAAEAGVKVKQFESVKNDILTVLNKYRDYCKNRPWWEKPIGDKLQKKGF